MPLSQLIDGEIENRHLNASLNMTRAKHITETLKHAIDLRDCRIAGNATNSVLTATASGSDLAFNVGSEWTTGFSLRTSDANSATVTQSTVFRYRLPPEYVAGGAISVAAVAGMLTNVSDTTATLDFSCYKKNLLTLAYGSDLVTTAATTINSLTFDTVSFVITPTGFVVGDELSLKMTIAITDGATGAGVFGAVSQIYMFPEIKG